MNKQERITAALRKVLQPSHLEVENQSHMHKGHSGDDGTGETHYHVVLRSQAFEGMSRIARHRAVHKALGAELVAQIHALSLDLDVG